MSQGWLKDSDEWTLDTLPTDTKIKRWAYNYVLVDHPSIPPEAGHVSLVNGAFVVVPNPDAANAS